MSVNALSHSQVKGDIIPGSQTSLITSLSVFMSLVHMSLDCGWQCDNHLLSHHAIMNRAAQGSKCLKRKELGKGKVLCVIHQIMLSLEINNL